MERERASVDRKLNNLAAMPAHGWTTATDEEARDMLLQTGGRMLGCGDMWDLVIEPLGVGVNRVSLERHVFA